MTALVLGTMYFGTKTDEKTSFQLLDRYVEAGGTVIDTANCYAFWSNPTGHGGQSEELIGRWLKLNPDLRNSLRIATKVGAEPVDGGGTEGLSAATIAREARRSLERLGIERIDLYWAHLEDRSVSQEEALGAFAELVDDGLVAAIGVSNHPVWRVEEARAISLANHWPSYSALQLSTSYVRPRPDAPVPGKDHRFGWVTDETIDYLDNHPDLELWAYSPLIGGSYNRPDRPFPEVYDHPGTTARLRVLKTVADELGVTPGQVVLAWLMPKIKPIIGASNLAQLNEALAAGDTKLTNDQRSRLNAAH
ncbi:aldo/keto reductase [Kribbella sp. NBC_01245]|uniref:aldo/keto reductase n=1 Tax=Kribbella sp. NBC_01245 TaxID=2903578 RepID=UPI002E2E48DF|nr:aldo/keto reductase [Kribbella sp. NBC_01245]